MSASVQTPTAEVKRSHNDSTSSSHDLSNKTTPVNRTPEKKSQRRSLQFFLPKLPSSESINMASSNMPSPCILTPNSALESLKMSDSIVSSDKSPQLSTSKLTRKESYKAQRKNYRQEKKRVADELLNSLKDPTVIVLADWLKVRGTLKSWTKLWCILKPGLLLLYKSPKVKSNHWVGTVVLNACSIIERPSKKDGFCFKLFHPMEQSIWAPRGPEKETIGAVVLPLPTSYLIFRAPSQAAGKCWLDALELSVRCSSLMVRSLSKPSHVQTSDQDLTANHDTQWSETDFEKHFVDHGNTDSDGGGGDQNSGTEQMSVSESDSELSAKFEGQMESPEPEDPPETEYVLKDEGDLACSRLDWDTCDHCEPKETDTADHTLRKCPAWRKEREELIRFFPDLEWPTIIERILADEDALTAFEKYCNAVQEARDWAERAQSGNKSVNGRRMKVPRTPRNNVLSFRYDVKSISAYFQNGQEGERWEVLVRQGEQVEELAEENKSLIWFLVKQVRPGMDLSKVVLPTFILEPRSFLDKLADSYYHADILSKAVLEDDAFTRMKLIVQWYLSGFYKKPKGLKKPYNPILGETFRCYWKHPSGSRTFYIAEQVSHHPPVSAFYVTNRQDGFTISGSILAKSKFYGNSTSAILDGVAILTLLPRGEDYSITVPYALCKGILVGTLSMELGGKVSIECEKTGYKTELEFKLKPLIGGSDYINAISGKLKLGKETLATIDGYWDGLTNIKDKRTGEEQVLFNPTPAVRSTRLQRYTVPISSQENYESEKLWEKISAAILCDDQAVATEEKTKLENAQRNAAKERKESGIEWTPRYFEQNLMSNAWMYKHCDLRPWDPRNDLHQYEFNYVISTKTRHRTPMIRTASIVSVDPNSVQPLLQTESRSSLSVLKSSKRRITNKAKRQESISSSQDGELHSDSSQWGNAGSAIKHKVDDKVMDKIKGIEQILKINSDRVLKLQQNLETLGKMQRDRDRISKKYLTTVWNVETLCVVAILSALQFVMMWFFMRKT